MKEEKQTTDSSTFPGFSLPTLGSREVLHRNNYWLVYRMKADFGSFSKEYYIMDAGQRSAIVVLNGDAILLERQYRLLVNEVSWEIPGGKVDPGETPAEAAVRECEEETGVRCRNVQHLIKFQPGLDSTNNPTQVFVTSDFEDFGMRSNPREVLSVEWVPLDRCVKMIFDGDIVDSLTIVSILAIRERQHALAKQR